MKINLGSGYRPQDGFVNIDIRSGCKPDLVCDLSHGLPFPDDSIEMVRAYDILEHIPISKTVGVIEEIWRVLKLGGVFESFTPSTDGRGAFSDPTHVSFWNKLSWQYYMLDMYRDLYGIRAKFEGTIRDIVTDPEGNVIHTKCVLRKVDVCL